MIQQFIRNFNKSDGPLSFPKTHDTRGQVYRICCNLWLCKLTNLNLFSLQSCFLYQITSHDTGTRSIVVQWTHSFPNCLPFGTKLDSIFYISLQLDKHSIWVVLSECGGNDRDLFWNWTIKPFKIVVSNLFSCLNGKKGFWGLPPKDSQEGRVSKQKEPQFLNRLGKQCSQPYILPCELYCVYCVEIRPFVLPFLSNLH